jgi:phosphopantothenoylcysteine decarboxylase / phosphopantothenate---cysteine ligase
MGFALAEVCARRGYRVILVSGPVSLTTPHSSIERIDVISANEMYEAATGYFADCDAAILCAAVADFTPETVQTQKVKRGKDDLVLKLKPTRDIAAGLGQIKKPSQVLVGFALETNDEEQNAMGKLKRKNLDFIVLNSLNDAEAGFAIDTNKITIIDNNGSKSTYKAKPKIEVAADIVDYMEGYLK